MPSGRSLEPARPTDASPPPTRAIAGKSGAGAIAAGDARATSSEPAATQPAAMPNDSGR